VRSLIGCAWVSKNQHTGSPISRPLSTVQICSSRCSAIFSLLGRRIGRARRNVRTLCLIAGYVNRTSHPSGSSENLASQFRPGGIPAPEASRYRHASKWKNNSMAAAAWRFQTLVARSPDDSLLGELNTMANGATSNQFAGSDSNPFAGSPAVAKLRQNSVRLKTALPFSTYGNRRAPACAPQP
jgi:hypothetical protein